MVTILRQCRYYEAADEVEAVLREAQALVRGAKQPGAAEHVASLAATEGRRLVLYRAMYELTY